jgi:hypothetical protein
VADPNQLISDWLAELLWSINEVPSPVLYKPFVRPKQCAHMVNCFCKTCKLCSHNQLRSLSSPASPLLHLPFFGWQVGLNRQELSGLELKRSSMEDTEFGLSRLHLGGSLLHRHYCWLSCIKMACSNVPNTPVLTHSASDRQMQCQRSHCDRNMTSLSSHFGMSFNLRI